MRRREFIAGLGSARRRRARLALVRRARLWGGSGGARRLRALPRARNIVRQLHAIDDPQRRNIGAADALSNAQWRKRLTLTCAVPRESRLLFSDQSNEAGTAAQTPRG